MPMYCEKCKIGSYYALKIPSPYIMESDIIVKWVCNECGNISSETYEHKEKENENGY